MGKVIYLYKVNHRDAQWSSTIRDLYIQIRHHFVESQRAKCCTTNISSLIKSCFYLLRITNPSDSIVFNHAITFWGLWPIFIWLKLRGVKFFFLAHEHEHILGLRYFFKHIRFMKLHQIPIYSQFWYFAPSLLSEKTFCLSWPQAKAIGTNNCIRLPYLGIDPSFFPSQTSRHSNQAIKVLFSHAISRYDKGFRYCQHIKNIDGLELLMGRDWNLKYNEVYLKYHNSDIVFLPSDQESYSLVILESLCTNSIIVTNRNVGAIQMILDKYSMDELAKRGLFIAEHNSDSYVENLSSAMTFALSPNQARTRELFDEFQFDVKSTGALFCTALKSFMEQK